MSKNAEHIEKRVKRSADAALSAKNYVSAIDLFLGIGWLDQTGLADWRQGRVPCLEAVVHSGPGKISLAMKVFQKWAIERGLNASRTVYLHRGKKGKTGLRFSKSGILQLKMHMQPIMWPLPCRV